MQASRARACQTLLTTCELLGAAGALRQTDPAQRHRCGQGDQGRARAAAHHERLHGVRPLRHGQRGRAALEDARLLRRDFRQRVPQDLRSLHRVRAVPATCTTACMYQTMYHVKHAQRLIMAAFPAPARAFRLAAVPALPSDERLVFPNREARIAMRHLHEVGAQTGGAARRHNWTR